MGIVASRGFDLDLVGFFLLTLLFLVAAFFLTAVSSSCRRIHKREAQKQLQQLGNLYFTRPLFRYLFPQQEFEYFFFGVITAQHLARFCYAVSCYIFISSTSLFHIEGEGLKFYDFTWFWMAITVFSALLLGFLFGELLPRSFGITKPQTALRLCTPFSLFFVLLIFPISYLLFKLANLLLPGLPFDQLQEATAEAKQEIIDIVHKAEFTPALNIHDKKLIEGVLDFSTRIVREVMAPRVDLFCLGAETPISEAAQKLYSEGFSRVPVYKQSIDNIIGVLMYKDIVNTFLEYIKQGNDPAILNAPVESITKPALYTPETKKISILLQEFRKKQVHLAIVVDEYGGTEGVVTIEDILEEIVGDISDEYDQAEQLFKELPDRSWIVDARMSIADAEEHMDIVIPQDGDYDTVGGYIYYRTGTIPPQGFTLHCETFDMEVLASSERAVEKVRITPFSNKS